MTGRVASGAVAALLVLTGCIDDAGDLMEQQEQQNAELGERRGADGALLRFGTLKNATLQLATGCHLPERELR